MLRGIGVLCNRITFSRLNLTSTHGKCEIPNKILKEGIREKQERGKKIPLSRKVKK